MRRQIPAHLPDNVDTKALQAAIDDVRVASDALQFVKNGLRVGTPAGHGNRQKQNAIAHLERALTYLNSPSIDRMLADGAAIRG